MQVVSAHIDGSDSSLINVTFDHNYVVGGSANISGFADVTPTGTEPVNLSDDTTPFLLQFQNGGGNYLIGGHITLDSVTDFSFIGAYMPLPFVFVIQA